MGGPDAKVVIIGGGGTGAAVAHDLCLRGFKDVCLFERGELTSGTTGRHHGLLHSGARYAITEPHVARECIRENTILMRISSGVIEHNNGLFVAETEEEEHYLQRLIVACADVGIPTKLLSSSRKILALEPHLNPNIRSAVIVPDGVFDAWRLPLQFFATAKHNGARIHSFTEVRNIELHNNKVGAVHIHNYITQKEERIPCDMIINASGAWAGQVAALCGLDVPVVSGAGCMVAVKERFTNMVINRSFYPGDGDIVLPIRNLSVIGTTNVIVDDPNWYEATQEEIDRLYSCADRLIPTFHTAPFQAQWAASRPLVKNETDDAEYMRDTVCIDHALEGLVDGMVSIIGGKATTLRHMAEQAVDMVCRKLNLTLPCLTAETPLRPYRDYYVEVA